MEQPEAPSKSGSFLFDVPVCELRVQKVGPRYAEYVRRLAHGHHGENSLSKSSSGEKAFDDEIDIESNLEYLKTLDPKEWKNQDHYAVLGVKYLRFNATDDQIRRAYRKMVLKHHPDKRKAKGEEVNTDDDYFTCITRAYETIGNPKNRRAYDSVDPEFDDSLPSTAQIEKDFFKVFDKYFKLNARWSEKRNVPEVGDEESSREHVDHFYNFWYNFDSWREYSYLDEEDKEKGQDREERRWIEKQNKAIRIKRKKEEMSRIRALVDLAYNNDPRILKFKNEEKQRKLAAKRAKMDAAQAQKAEEERIMREAQLAKEKAEQAEQKRIEQIRIENEKQKKVLKKERKVFRDMAKECSYYATNDKEKLRNMEGVEKICEMLKLLDLQNFNKELEKGGREVFLQVLKETEEKLEKEKQEMLAKSAAISAANESGGVKVVDKNAMWNNDNMQLLIKAVNLFPAGTVQRWEVIATYMNQHATNMGEKRFQARDILNKAKDLQSGNFAQSALKSQANEAAFSSFQKTRKELKKIDKADITVNTDAPLPENAGKTALKLNGEAKQNGVDSSSTKTPVKTSSGPSPSTPASDATKAWTKEEQALLEQAIKTYPVSTPDRWDRIAECIPNRTKKDCLRRVKELVDRVNAKKEAQQAVLYSMQYEVLVDFTRDYDSIRHALKKIEHFDKTNLENMLKGVSNILASNWGTQNFCQVLVFTDCGIGFGNTALRHTITNVTANRNDPEYAWLSFLTSSRLTFICLGSLNDNYFTLATALYQQFLDISEQKGQLFMLKAKDDSNKSEKGAELDRKSVSEIVERMCEANFKPFEATLKCGAYHKLECYILMWPPPVPYRSKDLMEKESVQMISKKLEICGFLKLSDIGSPVSVSRHLIVPRMESEKLNKKGEKSGSTETPSTTNEFEKLENEIRQFYAKGDGTNSDDEDGKHSANTESNKESFCVLLHGALKVESMAALVLLNDNWFGFIHSYADSKKKSNLMLNVLQPGNDIIPWLGDLKYLGSTEDALPGENPSFPVKADKRSYSQNCVVWIRQAGIQSDIQKVLRHAKKMPEKTPHFYKELNRIRRAALSLGFVELLEGLANIFDRESAVLPSNANPDCAIQLKHAGNELRKITNRDMKTLIIAVPTKYNQL